eukprot:3653061-Rhodomonas_salina.1
MRGEYALSTRTIRASDRMRPLRLCSLRAGASGVALRYVPALSSSCDVIALSCGASALRGHRILGRDCLLLIL